MIRTFQSGPILVRRCVQFVLGRGVTPAASRGGDSRRRPLFSEQCSERCRCASLPPSSETRGFEHRDPKRGADGTIKNDPRCRG
jgi:hypothetical protein